MATVRSYATLAAIASTLALQENRICHIDDIKGGNAAKPFEIHRCLTRNAISRYVDLSSIPLPTINAFQYRRERYTVKSILDNFSEKLRCALKTIASDIEIMIDRVARKFIVSLTHA